MAMTPHERDEMGRAGLEFVTSRFDLDGVLDSWESLYGELLCGSSAGYGASGQATDAAVRAGMASVGILKDVGGA
jgi:hypothetical protein